MGRRTDGEHRGRRRGRRWPIAAVAGVTLVALVGLAGGGWYYTDELLPAPQPAAFAADVEVVASDEAAGTLTLATDDVDLTTLDTVGLRTADGVVLLEGGAEVGAREVVRRGRTVTGAWPQVGDRGQATVDTFDGDPEATLGLAFDPVVVVGELGPLPAWRLVPDEVADPAIWAIAVHGRGAARTEANRILPVLDELGLNSFVVSVRGDPEAGAPPDGVGRYGDTEWADLQVAIDHLRAEEGAERFVLIGYSQGASIVLTLLRRGDAAADVDAAVLVSPLVSLPATLDLQARERGIPGPAIGPLLVATRWVARLRAGFDPAAVEHLDAVDDLAVPLLVTHGDADTTVPVEPSRALAEARPDLVTYEEYPGVGHVREWNADRQRFEADLATFLRAHVPTVQSASRS